MTQRSIVCLVVPLLEVLSKQQGSEEEVGKEELTCFSQAIRLIACATVWQ